MSDRHIIGRRTIELTWKCSNCGHNNRGRDTRCISCGSPKESDEKYVMPKDTRAEPTVTNPEQLRQAHAGPNWVCEYCGSHERALNGDCASCGGKKDRDSYHPESREQKTYHPEQAEVPQYASQNMMPSPYSAKREMAQDDDEHDDPLGLRRAEKMRIALVAGVIALIVCFIIWIFMPYKVNADVTDISWKHTVDLEQRFLRHGTGWESDMPSGSFNVSCVTRQRGTEDCKPYKCNAHPKPYDCNPYDCNCSEHCTDNENGFASCSTSCSTCYDTCTRTVYDTCYEQCPVYEDWCEYDYHEWEVINTKMASGDTHEEVWPTFDMQGRGDLRTRQKAEYVVTFHSDAKQKNWTYKPDTLDEFTRYVQAQEWIIKVNRAGMVWPQHIAEQ